MPDYELFAPDDATMQLALDALNMKAGAITDKVNGTIYAVDYYGTKYLQSGTKASVLGTVRNMVAQTGLYANVRFMGPSVLTLPANVKSAGATLKLATAPFYRSWE